MAAAENRLPSKRSEEALNASVSASVASFPRRISRSIPRFAALMVFIAAVVVMLESFMRNICEHIRGLVPAISRAGGIAKLLIDIGVVVLTGCCIFLVAEFGEFNREHMIADNWGLCAAALAAPLFCTLTYRHATGKGMYAGIIAGILTFVMWKYLPFVNGGSLAAYSGISGDVVGFAVSLLFTIGVSVCTQKNTEEELNRRLRRYSANLDAITVPQFLSLRFHDQRNLLNALGAVIIIVFFIPYTASGFAACGKLFNSLFGVDYMIAMILSAVVIVGYTIMGGFRAVTTTDLIQSIVMSIALVAVLGYGISVAGGWDAVVANAQSLPGYLTMLASHNVADNSATSYSLLDIVSTLAWGLGYFGMPHILLRFMAIEDEKKLVLSRRIASVWVVIAMTASIIIGMYVCRNLHDR